MIQTMNSQNVLICKPCYLLLLCLYVAVSPVSARRYTNPLHLTNGHVMQVADPYVYEADGLYYLSASTNQGFDYYTSRDLVTWDSCGCLFRVPEQEPIRTMLWASEVGYHDGCYYLTYSGWDDRLQRLAICLAISENPKGPFRLVYSPWISLPSNNVIDAHLFWDSDDTPYVFLSENGHFDGYGGGELRMARLKKDMSGLDGTLQPVNDERQPWELHMANPADYCNEAPEVFRYMDTYYMLYSANETHNGHYGVGVQTAPTPLGPWKKADYNPIMQTCYDGPLSETGLPLVSSPGHCGFVLNKSHRKGYLIYHRHAPWVSGYPSNDRVTCLDRFRIDHQGRLRTQGPSCRPQVRH